MDADELRKLMRQREPENIKLDFKQKLHAIDHSNKKVRAEHWNELIKDILALANGNIGTASQTGYLIIGVADKLNQCCQRLNSVPNSPIEKCTTLCKSN